MLEQNFVLLKNSDPTVLVNLHKQYHRNIFWVGKRWMDDEFVIESLIQDVFMKLWDSRDRIEDPKHIFFFLRYVMKRECLSYHCKPKNKFFKKVNSLDNYENYQDYMVGYDPENDIQNLLDQELQQKYFDQIQSVLPLLSSKRRRLIDLCLKYGFQYKAISQVMGMGIQETTREVKKAIQDIKAIIHHGGIQKTESKLSVKVKTQEVMTEGQKRVLELRCKEKHSFAFIANELNLTKKEVHKEFVTAYKLWQEEPLESA
ncbi:RNA polymerase sigma factor [Robertkochia solimangrovi]|uniref:RNA polymerase sigma factor n=1 Tax=Robertkochia solimangrovi TaxID=2213046 RepID=UPI00117F042C|nr:sigma-70 family RNA polymerase sigma factor [Robertkochia solimangrovi]TRZ42482.1 sigma-70 family RNA polymerase sigma factor [Robertkochia solimangrovi]